MSLVWRKIQRSNKKAAKFRFAADFQELTVHCTNKWQPGKLCVAWVHRRRKYTTVAHKWEPTITDPYKGLIVWPPESNNVGNNGGGHLEIETTMYRDSRNESFDDKEWTFIVEEVTSSGKHKPVAGINLNMRLFLNEPGSQTELKLKLKPLREHLVDCRLQVMLTCQTLGPEGDAFDDDMRSEASQMSVQNSIKGSCTVDDFLASADADDAGINSEDSLVVKRSNKTTAEEEADLPELRQFVKTASQDMDHILERLDNKTKNNDAGGLHRKEETKVTNEPAPAAQKLETSSSAALHQKMLDNQNDTSSDLMTWSKNVTKNYKNVKITDFSTSWRNGLAFCAVVHHFRPHSFDYDRLDAKNIFQNCSLAFDACASLGVARIISPADMVVLAIPDKIAVMTYVSLLRDLFTNQQQQQQIDQAKMKSRPSSFRSSFLNEVEATGSPSVPPKDIKWSNSESLSSRLNGKDLQQKPLLMTRNQLMNPFDSDEDIAKKAAAADKTDNAGQSSRPPVSKEVELTATVSKNSLQAADLILQSSSSSSVTSRALKLLEQYEKQPMLNNKDDDERKQALKERARRLIEDAKSGNLSNHNLNNLAVVTQCKTVKMSDVIKPVQYNNIDNKNSSPRSAPGTRQVTPDDSKLLRNNRTSWSVTKEWLQSEALKNVANNRTIIAAQSPSSQFQETLNATVEEFKRFGSMRGQELAKNLNILSDRIGRTVRSQSTPQGFKAAAANSRGTSSPSTSVGPDKRSPADRPDHLASPDLPDKEDVTKLLTNQLIMSADEIAKEMDYIQSLQNDLDTKATQVEKQWRSIMQTSSGSAEEQTIMNEYLSLLNERNMLTRREMHLSLLNNINEYESKFARVQNELGQLIRLDDADKTEAHKRRIDQLMDELITIVNKRDELMQQLMANEQATEEDAELAQDVMTQSTILPSSNHGPIDKESCSLQ